ncbi:hypothetical protein NUW58_g354 [Xylaria curta]|uniref:Uncharacterized protein n=1 Tax=Xylaria curta TaxID=42375 RepID=A0ACC1PRB7_9PEZI|nr:hypothetical protein NUW58_g354 [Xylaria curta]
MDGCAPKTSSWGQARDNEPVFSIVSSPSNSDDILYPGSDDETDEASKIAKRLRYERCGRRYLQGKPLRILSASLRGPFDKASGWQNPWLPKSSSQHGQCHQDVSYPLLASSPVRKRSGIHDDRPSSHESGVTEGQDDSIECHLPSPQSHENLQLVDSPSQSERRSQIESWVEHVHRDILQENQFWAPNRVLGDGIANSAKKHSSGEDWLKRRPAKRRKPVAFQSTETIYTPTPIPTIRPKLMNRKESAVRKKPANHSFEMATPSSSPGQGPRESSGSVDHQPITSCHEDVQLPVQSRQAAKGNIMELDKQECQDEERDSGRAHSAGPSGDVYSDKLQGRVSRSDEVEEQSEETIDFHDCADESFCYRARQLKQATPPKTFGATSDDFLSQCTRTEVPMLYGSDSGSNVSAGTQSRESNPKTTNDASNSIDPESANRRNKCSMAIAEHSELGYHVIATPEPDLSLLRCCTSMFQDCGSTKTSISIECPSEANIEGLQGDFKTSQHASELNIDNNIPHTILEVKEAHVVSTELFLDECPTLIGDPIDTEELGAIEPFEQNLGSQSFKGFSLLQHYAISATDLANTSQLFEYHDASALNMADDDSSHITTTIPQQAMTESQSAISKLIGQCSQNRATKSVTDEDAIMNQDDAHFPHIIGEYHLVTAHQQSPWAPLCTVDESGQPSNDNTELASGRESSTQPIANLLASPALVCCSPLIRPSQQSPWMKEAPDPVNLTKPVGAASMEVSVVMDVELHKECSSPLLLANQEHLSGPPASPAIALIPRNPPLGPYEEQHLDTSAVTDREVNTTMQDFPATPIPQLARQTTPDGEVSIRSFSNFNFSSPRWSGPPDSSASRRIPSSIKYPSARTSTKSSRRVSFAPLPCDEETNNGPWTKPRAMSPPPLMPVDTEEEDVGEQFRKHFDTINCRLNPHGASNLRYHQRLLPNSSQQKPESPSVGAMAEAFREADAQRLNSKVDSVDECTRVDEREAEVEEAEATPQSPWRHDSRGVDDVAAVMGNLTDFLDVWDIDTEMNRNRAARDDVNADMGISHGVRTWQE